MSRQTRPMTPRPISGRWAVAVALALTAILGAGTQAARAATIAVDCTRDSSSLASALVAANDGDTLSIQGTCEGTFEIAHSLTLAGVGDAALRGPGAFVVLTVDAGKTVTVSSLRISGGSHGVLNNGTLTLIDSTVSNNFAAVAGGGGIFSEGTLSLIGSAVTGNTASSGAGGGIFSGGSLTLSQSTVSANIGRFGGGVYISGGSLTSTDSTISGNTATALGEGGGGGLYSELRSGPLALSHSIINNNSATSASGGGIFNLGTLSITDSTVSRNSSASLSGGGISNAAVLTMTGSTVSGNSASLGGGIDNTTATFGVLSVRGMTTITNSTVSGNSARVSGDTTANGSGGGIFNSGVMTLTSSTISGNVGKDGGGVYSSTSLSGGTTTLVSTLIADQASGGNCLGTVVVDGGYNLDDDGSCGLSAAMKSLTDADPLLNTAGLQDNGGPTKTIALMAGSPAIDAIPVGMGGCGASIATDQRGVSRPQGAGCDIGAYEVVQTPGQLLASLAAIVKGVGPGTSLADKVAEAAADLESADLSDACSILTAFIKEVGAQSGKTIPASQAASLVADADQAETGLGCEPGRLTSTPS